MALAIATVANSIAALSVSGVTIKDVDEIPSEVDTRSSMIIPLPNYATDWTFSRDSFGAGSALQTVSYTLNYRLCYKLAGTGRVVTIEHYDGIIDKAALFLDAVMAIDTLTGAVDIVPYGITNMGIVNDPAEIEWLGCDLAVRVTEFVN
jgi:hypothetical protein